jgi:hypothetical protein
MFFVFPGRGVFAIFGVTTPSVMFSGFPSGAVFAIFGVVMRSVMFSVRFRFSHYRCISGRNETVTVRVAIAAAGQ